MLDLETIRRLYPQYNDMTDYELSQAVHQKGYKDVPYEQFAREFGAPLEEDKVELAVRQYNMNNPDNPITAEDIRAKDRSGIIGGLRLLGEGMYDAITDTLPDSIARIYRGGDIGPDKRSWADDVIEQQRKDQLARIPSLQEVEGGYTAKSLYEGPLSIATSMATGLGGMYVGAKTGAAVGGLSAGPAGAAAGGTIGGMIGAAALTYPSFYRMAKDQFVEEVQREYESRYRTKLSAEQAQALNEAIDEDAHEFGLWEAGPEALSQALGAGLIGGAFGKVMAKIGLGGLSEKIGARAITRIPAKIGTEVAGENITEGMTYGGQEHIRYKYGLRDTEPTVGEFLGEQAGPVTVGAALHMGLGGAGHKVYNRIKGRHDETQANEDPTQNPPEQQSPTDQQNPADQSQASDNAAATEEELPEEYREWAENYERNLADVEAYERAAWEAEHGAQEENAPADPGAPLAEEGEAASRNEQPQSDLAEEEERARQWLEELAENGEQPGQQGEWVLNEEGREILQPEDARQEAFYADLLRWGCPIEALLQIRNENAWGDAKRIEEIFKAHNYDYTQSRMEIEARERQEAAQAEQEEQTAEEEAVDAAEEENQSNPQNGTDLAAEEETARQWLDELNAANAQNRGREQIEPEKPEEADDEAAPEPLGGLDGLAGQQAEQQQDVAPAMPTESELTNTQEAPRADTQKAAEELGLPTPEALPQEAQGAETPGAAPETPVQEGAVEPLGGLLRPGEAAPYTQGAANANGTLQTGQTTQENGTEAHNGEEELLAGLQQGDLGRNVQRPDGDEGGSAGRSAEEGGGENPAAEEGTNRRKIKIPERPDENVSFELMEADDVQASHIPERGFQRNPAYRYENERRYHDEPHSRTDVLEHAGALDPDMLMESVDANQGAPIIDRQGNVLGGNSRAMSIRMAYEKFPQKAQAYKEALKKHAARLGIDAALVDKMKNPMLVRKLEREIDGKEAQDLISALNESFTKRRNARSESKSRGDRLSARTLESLARGLAEADSLRSYFDDPASFKVVEMLIADGVIQPSERNAYCTSDGYLNPEGKRLVEEALRGRIANSYEVLHDIPTPVLNKLDAAIPHILIAEQAGAEWNITSHVSDAIDLLAEFETSGKKSAAEFLEQRNMMNGGKTPSERYSAKTRNLFLMMLDAKKKEFVTAFSKYAGQASISDGLGIGQTPGAAFGESFDEKNRSELLKLLPEAERANARRTMSNQEIRERLKELKRAEKEAAQEESKEAEEKGELPLVASVEAGVIHKTENMSLVQAAQKWIKENVINPVATRIGNVIVDGRGIKDSLSHGFSGPKVDAIPAIVPTLEKGAYLGEFADKDGNPIANHFFAAKARIGGKEKIVFVRVRKAAGADNRFYVHEVYTEEEIKEAAKARGVTDQDRPFQGTAAYYKNLIADYLEVNRGGEKNQKTAGDSFQSPDSNTPLNQASIDGQNPPPSSETGNNISDAAQAVNNRDYGTADNPNTIALGEHFAERFEAGENYSGILAARREAAKLLGVKKIPDAQTKAIDEAIELGVVKCARKTIEKMRAGGKSDAEIFKALVDLYRRQPILSSRTSESVEQQAYSTPAPIAFLASRLAGINGKTRVYEPTAGNGALLIEAKPQNATVNELNEKRAERLRAQGFEVTENNAAEYAPTEKAGAVIANPPFGRIWDDEHKNTLTIEVDGFETKELDQAIVVKALQALKPNGRAVVIIGGKQGKAEERRKKYAAASQVKFWKYLSENYRIADHFSIDGKLYSRQGASYPIDIIVIDNKGKSGDYVFPGGEAPRVYHSFEELEGLIDEQVDSGGMAAGDAAAEERRDAGEGSGGIDGADRMASSESVPGRSGQGTEQGGEVRGSEGNGEELSGDTEGKRPGDVERAGGAGSRNNRPERRGAGEHAGGRSPSEQDNDVGAAEGRGLSSEAEERGGDRGLHQGRRPELGRDDSAGLVEEKRDQQDDKERAREKPAQEEKAQEKAAENTEQETEEKQAAEKAGEEKAQESGEQQASEKTGEKAREAREKPTGEKAQEENKSAEEAEEGKGNKGKEKPLKPTEHQTPYQKASKLASLGTLVPKNMATAIKKAFAKFRKEHGDIDRFVAKELGYEESELGKYFAAEQVDAIGLAISNLKKGAGFIIGDQTGIGKGRVNAAIIRWAKRNGKIPVFITMNPQLYGDMIRDLSDIGMEGFNALPTNNLTGQDAIDLPDGRKLKTGTSAKHKKVLQDVMRNGPGEDYDAVFTTYSQLDSNGGDFRREFMMNIAHNALFILDESHNAGGTKGAEKTGEGKESRAKFMRNLLRASPNGVFYSSATYAKRPDVMDLYMKTDMRLAVNDGDSLGEAINRGGIPMQQVTAAQLAEAGQYLRRERTWEGAEVGKEEVETDSTRADACAQAMRAIMAFDRAKQKALAEAAKKSAGKGLSMSDNSAANEKGTSSTTFSSVMHNLINQSLLSQKVSAIVKACKEAIAAGEKPVITLSNTMGSAIEEYAKLNGIAVGDPIMITFEDLFLRYLQKVRTITVKEGNRIVEQRVLTDQELGPVAASLFREAEKVIKKAGVNQLPVSFIDMITEGLRKEGISVGEITGRNVGIDYSGSVPVLARQNNSTTDKIKTVNAFNSGELDCVILNSAGSTGISLHASEKFKDKRRRTMIVAQPDANIDVFMQTLGRIFRTGQVVPPKYKLLFTKIPAEKRLAAVLAKKMASLNANTSAAKDSDASFKNIPDFMNKYGDRVAMQIAADFPELHAKMGEPLAKKDNAKGDSLEGAMQKLTGYIPLLSVSEQKQIYDALEAAYNDLVAQLEATGDLDLDAKPLPLDAKLLGGEQITPAREGGTGSPFAEPAILGRYSVKKLGKPLTAKQVRELVEKGSALDIEAERKAFKTWLKKRLDKIKPEMRAEFEKRAERNLEVLEELGGMLKPGVTVELENQNTGQKILGVVVNVSKKGKAENPTALSNYQVQFAVADAAKRLTFPFSQIIDPSSTGYSFVMGAKSLDEACKVFNEGQSESREEVYIATGNILGAFERLERGKVIIFEDENKNLIPGLMLPRDKKASDILNGLDVVLTAGQAIDFLKELPHQGALVKTEDKNCVISREYESSYRMAVPASKAKGGQYFLNREILEAAGKDFFKRGNSMILDGLSEEKMLAVLHAMQRQGTGLIADGNKDVAREISGQKQITEDTFRKKPDGKKPQADQGASLKPDENGSERHIFIDHAPFYPSLRPGEFLRERDAKAQGSSRESVQEIVDSLDKAAKNAAQSEVVQSFEELPQHLQDYYAENRESLEAVYDPATNKVYFVADNISDAKRAAELWAHEQIVHNGLRGMLSESERKSLLNQLWMNMGGMGNALVRSIAERYGLNPRRNLNDRLTVMEEAIAKLAEGRKLDNLSAKEQGLWKKVVRAIANAWNKVVEKVCGKRAETGMEEIDRLLSALGRYVIDGMPAQNARGESVNAMASVGEGKVNSYGVPMERVTEIEGNITTEIAQELLSELNKRDLYNKIEEVKAQVNANQKKKILSSTARAKSILNGFTGNEHDVAASKIANAWQWGALGVERMDDEGHANVRIERYVSALQVNGENSFAWLTVKKSNGERKIYSIELMNEGELKTALKKDAATAKELENKISSAKRRREDENLTYTARSFDEILNRLSSPVNENSRPLASLSLRDITGMGAREAAQAANDPEISHYFRKGDLSLLQNIAQLPHWIAKQFPKFKKIYERQLRRRDERAAALMKSLEGVPSLFGENRLGAEDMASLKELLWNLEGSETELEKKRRVSKFLEGEKLASGRYKLEINPKFYDVFQEVLDGQKATTRAKEAMMEIRKSLDDDLVTAYNRMAEMREMSDDAITKLRDDICHVPNYFPHHRYGKYFVQAKDASGEVVYRRHFDALNEAQAKKKALQIAREQKADFPDAKWSDGLNTKLPDEVLGAPIDAEAMEQIIKAAAQKIGDKERAAEVRELLTKSVSDVLKTRGWGSHGIKRKGTPGFETEDIEKVLYDYKAGLNGWLTKMEAARDFSAMLGKIDARQTPRLWKYAAQYVQDMLRNSDGIDRTVGTIKSIAFAWYLGANIKTAFVNATQNLVVGVPRLQMDVTGGARMYLSAAQDALVDQATGRKGKGLPQEEHEMLQELYDNGEITDAFMTEIRGHLEGVSGASLWNRFTKIMGLPMSMVERFNRASLALAAYRAAMRGSLKEGAKRKYGVIGKATHEQAVKFATDVVRDAHFVYGKSNMPEFMRSNATGRFASSMYTFRTFTHNMVAMWLWALKTQGVEGAKFTAKSLGATMALGGVTALPLYATLMALFQLLAGDDDDWTEMLRDSLPKDNTLRDVICYGMPALAGVNVGGSLKMETPVTRGLAQGSNPEQVLTKSIGDIIGIPYDLGIVRPSRIMEAVDNKNYWRAVEEAAPTFVKNGMQAWRLFEEGQTTMKGRAINAPGRQGARRLTAGEAIGKSLGFQPVSSTKSYEAYAAEKRRETVRSNKLDEVTVIALQAYDAGDKSYQRKAMKRMEDWNEKMKRENKPYMMFNWKDVMRRVKARRRKNSQTPKQIEKGARQSETWGL